MADKPLPEGTDRILDEDGLETAASTDDELLNLETNAPDGSTGVGDGGLGDDEAMIADDIALERQQETAGNAAPEGDATQTGSQPADLREALLGKFGELRGEATDRAFAFAQSGKDRATAALDDVIRSVEDAAAEIDSRIGTQYGDYVRRAAESLSGYSDAFKAKEIDDLFGDARELVKKAPAVAVGAAAAFGFVVARLIKAGVPDAADKDSPRQDARAD